MVDLSNQNIDTDGYVPQSFELFPKGKYRMALVSSEKKTTSSNDGAYLNFEFKITEEGPHKGRSIWKMFNIENPNPVAVKIGMEQLTGLALACGVQQPKNTEELHAIEIIGDIVIKKQSEKQKKKGYTDDYNDIRTFLPIDDGEDADTEEAEAGDTDAEPWK